MTTTLDPIRALTVTAPRPTQPVGGPPPRAPRVAAGDRHVLIQDPPSGTTVQMAVGRQLVLRFRPRVGTSRWRVAERPEHLVPLAAGDHELCFLVFGGAPGRLRLERADPAGGPVQEVREVLVQPAAGRAASRVRASRSPARSTARTTREAS